MKEEFQISKSYKKWKTLTEFLNKTDGITT